MNLKKLILENNACYKCNKKHKPAGIFVHTTGANNPNLKRYVGPDDGELGVNKYNNHWNTYKPDNGRLICPHAFIGKLENGEIATYQTLPWDMIGWHSGQGSKGNANYMGYIGFEICEDDMEHKDYFDKVYKEAVELCAMLVKEYDIDIKNVIGHYEGHLRGIASNHGDPKVWFDRYDVTMDDFRQDVAKLVGIEKPNKMYRVQVGAFRDKQNAKRYVEQLKSKGIANAFIVESDE